MRRTGGRRGLWDSVKAYWRWKQSNVTAAASAAADKAAQDGGNGGASRPRLLSPVQPSSSPLQAVTGVVHDRRSCKRFDPTRPVDLEVLEDLLAMTTRAPTALNLQPWVAVVVHEAEQRAALADAALGQPQPRDAPVTVVFAGDMEPERNAPAALELGLESGYYHPMYGAGYLRSAYYLLHGGPMESMSHAKSLVSTWYSETTGQAMLSVPTNKQAYAWKQAMIPATTFLYLATAAGFDTAILEGFDEAQVRRVAGLPARFTVPVIISVGHGAEHGFHSVRSPRFHTRHLIRWGKF
ncbi:nitroreductase [Trypanosoma conorhini]|uniref:Nitroreductase n=1 Tax=Trypanosoma conorhini TaxID=83891 RepID=A0A422QBS1_9TRYP|nr:nitroreductase [Trypanosoma conorhini]RNF27408.1 nitroreductase [Trypanosoma conorhini]